MAGPSNNQQRTPTSSPQPVGSQGVAVPPGRSLADVPKGAKLAPPSGNPKPANTRQTFQQFLTDGGSKGYLVDLLVDLGKKKKKGPWKEYLEFFRANMSGDMDSMDAATKNKCEKISRALNDEYLAEQDL